MLMPVNPKEKCTRTAGYLKDLCYACLYEDVCYESFSSDPKENISDLLNNVQDVFYWVSGILLMLVSFFILYNKNLKHHPYPLIGFACLTEAVFWFSQVTTESLCLIDAPKIEVETFDIPFNILKIKTNRLKNWKRYFDTLQFQLTRQKVMSLVSFELVMLSNYLIVVDLFWTIKNPFVSREKRSRYYFLILLLFGLTFGVFTTFSVFRSASRRVPSYNIDDIVDQNYSFLNWYRAYLVIVSLATLITGFLITLRLLSHATSRELRLLVLKRHAVYILLYFLMIMDQFYDLYP
jgi:hypothetical protein